MPLAFYPSDEIPEKSSLREMLEALMDAAEKYRGVVLDAAAKQAQEPNKPTKRLTPRELSYAYNWEEISKVLKEIRDMPEATQNNRQTKSEFLTKLAEVYEVLRAAKMPKLEAVRLALINEAGQLRAGTTQVA